MLSVTENFFFFFLLLHQPLQYANGTHFPTYWWNVKPYIFTEDGEDTTGIIPDILKKFNMYCTPNYTGMVSKMLKHSYGSFNNYSSFLKALQSNNITYNETVNDLGDISWFPVMSRKANITDKRFATLHLFEASGAFVIVKRDFISFQNKILYGVQGTMNLIFLVIVFAFCVGLVIWIWVRIFYHILKMLVTYSERRNIDIDDLPVCI